MNPRYVDYDFIFVFTEMYEDVRYEFTVIIRWETKFGFTLKLRP